MKKIGILTYHRATNYGAVLQAYSLSTRLKNDLAGKAEVEIIDYSTKKARNDHIRAIASNFIHDGFSVAGDEYRKNRMFARFSNSLPISSHHVVSDDINVLQYFLNDNYDIVISGSDAVFSWNGKVFPTAYLLGGKSSYKKYSYAASAHRLKYKKEDAQKIQYCHDAFGSYTYLGIRDTETEQFVRYCNPQCIIEHNCDPTLLLDMNSIRREVSLEHFLIDMQKPLILVMTPNESVGRQVMNSFAGTHNIVSLFIKNKAIKNHLATLNPFEWASIFKMADITVTEYFHATILSLLNGTPTVSIDSLCYSEGYEGKIHDLLFCRLNLPEMYINQDELSSNSDLVIEKAKKVLAIDYSQKIRTSIEHEAQYYLGFKERIIKDL